jgi:2,5-dihydroxypyridine 5,6-dioxygenase
MDQELVELFKKEFQLCRVQPSEKVIVLSGPHTRPEYISYSLQALASLGADAFQVGLATPIPFPIVGRTPLKKLPLAMKALMGADFVVDLYFLLHSPEQIEILRSGTRILLIMENAAGLKRLFPTEEIRKRTESAASILKSASKLRITSAAGTDLTMKVGDYPVVDQYGYTDQPGRWDNWPSGAFVYTWPNETSADGRVVLSPGDYVWPLQYLDESVTLTVRNGRITAIQGAASAAAMTKYMEQFDDPEGYALSHTGWGLDKRAVWEMKRLDPESLGMDPRAFCGNVMISTGPNTEVGGTRDTACHLDIPMRNCDLYLDDQVVVLNGKLVSEQDTQ